MSKKTPSQPFALGIDLGGTKIAVGLCRSGHLEKKVLVPTPVAHGAKAMIAAMVKASREAMAGCDPAEIAGVGVGAAGQIDARTGTVIYAPNLGWEKVPLGEELQRALGLRVRVVNDVRAATIAELHYGAGKGCSTFVNIFVGTGIGSGWVVNGALLEGITNSAGEIGHTCLDPQGPLCGCGHRGCFEAFSSGRGVENYVKTELVQGRVTKIRELVEDDPRKVTGRIIGTAAREKDELALEALRRAGTYIGLVVANLHTMVNPDTVILGGGLMALKEFILPSVEVAIRKHILPVAWRDGLFTMARCENDAGVLGGAALFSA